MTHPWPTKSVDVCERSYGRARQAASEMWKPPFEVEWVSRYFWLPVMDLQASAYSW